MGAVFSIGLLLVFLTYIFAVGFTQVLSGYSNPPSCFTTVPKAMYCLLMEGVFHGQSKIIVSLMDMHWVFFIFVVAYFTLACLVVMKMLIGVVCNVITTVAKAETEARVVVGVKKQIGDALSKFG